MRHLHLSREVFHANVVSYNGEQWNDPKREARKATPACGSTDDRGIIRRGMLAGLVRRAAWDASFHCADCVRVLREARADDETEV